MALVLTERLVCFLLSAELAAFSDIFLGGSACYGENVLWGFGLARFGSCGESGVLFGVILRFADFCSAFLAGEIDWLVGEEPLGSTKDPPDFPRVLPRRNGVKLLLRCARST